MNCACPPEIIPVSFELPEPELLTITGEPKTWATLKTDEPECVAIEAVHLELTGFDPANDSLALYADAQKQVSLAGAMRPLWSYRPGFATACPGWLIPGPTLTGGYRAECRLPATMLARTLRLWTSLQTGRLLVSGSVFFRWTDNG